MIKSYLMQENEYYNTNKITIKNIEPEEREQLNYLFNWLQRKNNTINLYNKTRVEDEAKLFKGVPSEDIIKNNFYELSLLLTVLTDKKKLYKPSPFYIIVNKNRISHPAEIISIDFTEKANFTHFLNLLNSLLSQIDELFDHPSNIQDINSIFIYFPFKIGNIFSKKHYLYEINEFRMESLFSYRSLDKDRRSILESYQINSEHATLNEFYNKSRKYSSEYAYIDYIEFLINNQEQPVYYIDSKIQDNYDDILNMIDNVYFDAVHIQQMDVYNIIKNRLRIPENNKKGSQYSFNQLLRAYFQDISRKNSKSLVDYDRKLRIHLKKNLSNSNYLHRLQKSYKKNSLSVYENIVFSKVATKFPLYTNKDYVNNLTELLEQLQIKNCQNISAIVDIIFGEESTLYAKDDKRKIFFKDVKELLLLFNSSNFDYSTLKYLINFTWDTKVVTALNRLKNGQHAKKSNLIEDTKISSPIKKIIRNNYTDKPFTNMNDLVEHLLQTIYSDN